MLARRFRRRECAHAVADFHPFGECGEFAVCRLGLRAVVGHQHGHQRFLRAHYAFGLRVDHHAGFYLAVTGGNERSRALDFYGAHAAHPHGLHAGLVAEPRNIDAHRLRNLPDARAGLGVDFPAVDGDGYRLVVRHSSVPPSFESRFDIRREVFEKREIGNRRGLAQSADGGVLHGVAYFAHGGQFRCSGLSV